MTASRDKQAATGSDADKSIIPFQSSQSGYFMAERVILRYTDRELPFHLTPRQTEILPLMASGLTHAEIATQLGISSRTVDNIVCGAKNPVATPRAPDSEIGIFGVVQRATGKRPTQHSLAMDLLLNGFLK